MGRDHPLDAAPGPANTRQVASERFGSRGWRVAARHWYTRKRRLACNQLLCGGELRVDMTTKEAFEALKKAIQADHSYAWSWHCNVAMPFQDEGGSHEQANRAVARFMQTAFDVDVTTFDEWKAFPWAKV